MTGPIAGGVGGLFGPLMGAISPKTPKPPEPPKQIVRAYGHTYDLSKPGDVQDYENRQRQELESTSRPPAAPPAPEPAAAVPQLASVERSNGPSAEQRAQEEASREARRALAAASGRRSTLLTGGLGVTEPAPVRRRGLLGA